MQNPKTKTTLFTLLYLIGLGAGFTLVLLTTWADLESTFYGFPRRASARLNTLSCPLIMNRTETASYSVRIDNPLERNLNPAIRLDVSTPGLSFSDIQNATIAPGESATLQWTVGPENVDLERFIFIQVLVYSTYPIPDRENSCGVYVIDSPLSGRVISWGMIITALLGMGVGLYGLNSLQETLRGGIRTYQSFLYLAGAIAVGIALSFTTWVIYELLFFTILALFLFIVLVIPFTHFGERRHN